MALSTGSQAAPCKYMALSVFFLICILLSYSGLSQTGEYRQIPEKDMPTVLDLGAKACVPCKMMAPILEKLEREYRGRAAVIFVDVWKDASEAKRFGIRTIPTQIFFDRDGTEVFRHEGFLDEESIVRMLDALGAKLPGQAGIKPVGKKEVEPKGWLIANLVWVIVACVCITILIFSGLFFIRFRKGPG